MKESCFSTLAGGAMQVLSEVSGLRVSDFGFRLPGFGFGASGAAIGALHNATFDTACPATGAGGCGAGEGATRFTFDGDGASGQDAPGERDKTGERSPGAAMCLQ